MLDTNDLKAIARLIDGSIDKKVPGMIVSALGEFFENVLAPYLDKKFKDNDNDHDTYFLKLELSEVRHGEILAKLEEHSAKLGQNDKDQKQIFEKLDEIESNTRGHEVRRTSR